MIEYKNVALRYAEKTVLKDVNLRIEDGEFMVLVGPSGSGKTTMMKMINQLIEPTDGNIYLNKKRIKDHHQRELRLETGYVLQQIALFPNLTVAENIALIPEMKGWKKEQIQEQTKVLLEKVGLSFEDYAHRYPKELSGGEQQRVGIVRAIIATPKILLMDEPFSALDAISRKQLQDLTKQLHQEFKMTTLFVTHDTDEAVKLADRIAVLKDGEIVQVDTPYEIQTNPANAFVKELFKGENIMNEFIRTFQERNSEWMLALGQHLQLSLLALLLAVVIAIPVAVLVSPSKKISGFLLQIAGIIQTLPSLALIGLFIPLMGIGTLPALTTLVLYALFPILQNTITGLQGIDESLVEAGIAFGMTKIERLKKFEIALAMPVIMSGIRTAAVFIIGTATLAALIGAGGLGSFILLGIDRNNSSLILIGAISAAILAILFNFLLKWMETAKLRTILAAFLVLIIGLGTSYAPTIAKMQTSDKLVIAGKLGPEPEILMNMYKLLIEDQTKLKVEVKPNFGKTNFLYEALKKGDIDIYPEFSGTITESLLKNKPKVSHEPEEVYEVARKGILEQDGFVFLKPMAYQNTYAVAVPKSLAEAENLTKISDLKKVNRPLKAGFTLEFNDREDGNKGLQSMYGLQLDVATMEPALRYQAIQSGDIQVTDAYSTDAEISRYQLKVLEDDKQLFPPYQGAPLMKQELLKKHPELEGILNQLAGKISEEEMSQMNFEVGANGRPAEDVAREYLLKINLLKK